jgi:hypothetical protein
MSKEYNLKPSPMTIEEACNVLRDAMVPFILLVPNGPTRTITASDMDNDFIKTMLASVLGTFEDGSVQELPPITIN